MIKKIKDIILFIDDKIIMDVKGSDAKIRFSSTTTDITLPYYIVDGVFDSTGENERFILMSYGNTTLKSLQNQAINETNCRKKLKN